MKHGSTVVTMGGGLRGSAQQLANFRAGVRKPRVSWRRVLSLVATSSRSYDTEAVSPAGDDVEPVLGRWAVRVVAWLRS